MCVFCGVRGACGLLYGIASSHSLGRFTGDFTRDAYFFGSWWVYSVEKFGARKVNMGVIGLSAVMIALYTLNSSLWSSVRVFWKSYNICYEFINI